MKKASVYLLLICLLSSCSLKYNYEVNPYDIMGVIDDDGEYEEYVDEDEYRDEETTEEKIRKIVNKYIVDISKD